MLSIGFAGGLQGWDPADALKKGPLDALKDWCWEYQPRNIDFSTRSGYFLFRGLSRFKQLYPELTSQLHVNLWGRIRDPNKRQVDALDLQDIVTIEGFVDRAASSRKLEACDVLFLPLESSLNGQRPLFIPGKFFEYLKTGKPILALAEPSDCVDILREAGTGIVCSPFDADGVAEQLAQLVRQRDRLSELFEPNWDVIERYAFKELVVNLAELFDDILIGQ